MIIISLDFFAGFIFFHYPQFRKLPKVFDDLSLERQIFVPGAVGRQKPCTSSCGFCLDSRVFPAFFDLVDKSLLRF